jgi:hypothetical protein
MIITAPLRRMILHLSQRGFIDVRTFISDSMGTPCSGHGNTIPHRGTTC